MVGKYWLEWVDGGEVWITILCEGDVGRFGCHCSPVMSVIISPSCFSWNPIYLPWPSTVLKVKWIILKLCSALEFVLIRLECPRGDQRDVATTCKVIQPLHPPTPTPSLIKCSKNWLELWSQLEIYFGCSKRSTFFTCPWKELLFQSTRNRWN